MFHASPRIIEAFLIAGRGVVVAVDRPTGLPEGYRGTLVVIRPDGSTIRAEAFREHLLRRAAPVDGTVAWLLRGVELADVPIGSVVKSE